MRGGWIIRLMEWLSTHDTLVWPIAFILWLMTMSITGAAILWALFVIFSVCF